MTHSLCRLTAATGMFIVGCAVNHDSKMSVCPLSDAVMFADDFERYDDVAAFERTWTKDGVPQPAFDLNFGRDSRHSVKLSGRTSNSGATNRYVHDLSRPLLPSDAAPVTFSYDLYLPEADAADQWHNPFQSVDLRGYSGGRYKAGDIGNVVSLGLISFGLPGPARDFYQCRVYTDAAEPLNQQYHTLSAGPRRSSGWHTLSARIGATRIAVTVDGQPAGNLPMALKGPLTSIVIGADVGNVASALACDNIRVTQPTGER